MMIEFVESDVAAKIKVIGIGGGGGQRAGRRAVEGNESVSQSV